MSTNRSRWAQLVFVIFAFSLVVFYRDHPQFHTLGITFVAIVLEAFPFMLLGTVVGGFIEVFVAREKITKWLPERRWAAVFLAAGLGVAFPVCECAIVPVVRRLLKKGIPLSTAIAFLLGGPIVNPLVAVSTAVAYFFNWSIVLQRLILGYLIAVTVGLLMDVFFTKKQAILADVFQDQPFKDQVVSIDPGKHNPLFDRISLAVSHAADDFFDIGRFLVFGAFFAGLAQTLLPGQIFISIVQSTALSILSMMALAMVLNLCSEADAFVAASFRSTPVPLSAQMGFMVLGPMLDIKLLLMYLKVFRKRPILFLATMTFLVVLFSMIVLEWVSK